MNKNNFRCIIHGSFRKHFNEIVKAKKTFEAAGIEVLAPRSEIDYFDSGFAILQDDKPDDPRIIELLYLHNLKRLGENGFSYFVDTDGYIGGSAAYELGVAQISNVPCFFSEKFSDHPAYQHKNSIWKVESLAEYIKKFGKLPDPRIKMNERQIHKLWVDLMVPGSVIAVGAIIEHQSFKKEKEILLVKTHKWGDRYSIVGGRVKRNERLDIALQREIFEETKLKSKVGQHLCTFDQLSQSNYYQGGIQHVFVDKTVVVDSKKVRLNNEAEEYLWMPAKHALKNLDIEPNARHTLEIYAHKSAVHS